MPFEKIRILSKIKDDNLGCSEEQIKSVEIKLGIDLPNGLKSYYREIGNHNGKISFYNDMINIDDLEFDKQGFLAFYSDSQDAVKWGIQKDEINNENLFVYNNVNNWNKDNHKLMNTIIGIGLRNALTTLPFFAFRWEIEETEEKKVYDNFQKLEEGFKLWNTYFFQNQPNEILSLTKVDKRISLYIASNNEKDFNQIKSIFKDDWYSRENQLNKLKEKYKNKASS